jgi:hypothetical protein
MGNSETSGSSDKPTDQTGDGTVVKAAAQRAQGSTPSDNAWVDVAVPVALETGWTIAVLFGQLSSGANDGQVLPTEHELSERDRVHVELTRLSCLLTTLKKAIPQGSHQMTTNVEPLQKAYDEQSTSSKNAHATSQLGMSKAALNEALLPLNIGLLADLACASREVELAYQVGRSLRDTANPPSPMALPPGAESPGATAPNVDRQAGRDRLHVLEHDRVAVIQEWLKSLGPHLPADSAAVVSKSLGRWSDFASTAFDNKTPGRLRSPAQTNSVADQMIESLLPQGDVWLSLLTGQQATAGLLTPEGYVAAGEAALGRSARIVVRVVQHYWAALTVLVLALAAIISLAAWFLGGAGMVWTQIAAIAGSLGITARGIATATGKLVREGEQPIYAVAKQDAIAWAVTNLPRADLTSRGVRRLRRSGVRASAPLGKS